MQLILRKYGDFRKLKFELDLTEYSKNASEIIDILCTIKSDVSSNDNVLFEKKESTGGISRSTSGQIATVEVTWDADEYDNFTIGNTYVLGLFPKFNGETSFDESVDDFSDFSVKIIQDLARQ